MRDPAAPEFGALRTHLEEGGAITIDLLYGDFEGGQRTISRFGMLPTEHGGWITAVSRHWNLDRPDPR